MAKYVLKERAPEELRALVPEYSAFLQDLFHTRNLATRESIEAFLEPSYERDSHDPFLLPDMEAAVSRILRAVENKESVCVWSDYDCDGVPGGVMLTDFFRRIGLVVVHYIPHRHKEGYGLNEEGLSELASQGVTLVVTIDLGTMEHANIEFAREKGIDVIVTDHHEAPPELPRALALLNPKRKDSAYPFDGLCGAGVAWKLVQAVLARNRFDIGEGQEKWYLDLVGLATLSDMVPLVGENRMLARYGLLVLKKNRRPGFAALLSALRIKALTLTEDDVGFMISPRINAASRMDSPALAARLLATQNVEEAFELARSLDAINTERKTLVATTVKEANRRMEEGVYKEKAVIVMGSPSWRPGILGLVANSLAEAHGKPVFLWGREGGEILRGSCRSDGVVSVVDLMRTASDVFGHYGGHIAAGGFSVDEDKVHLLSDALTRAYAILSEQGFGEKEIIVDRELSLAEVLHAHRELARLAPFGEGNKKPLFKIPRVKVEALKVFGKAKNHLEIRLSTESARVSGIAFFATPTSFTRTLEVGMEADVFGHVESDWGGRARVRIVDIL